MNKGPIVLAIMDGWGLAEKNKGNAVALAKTPNLQYLTNNFSHTTLRASGLAVGLPFEQDGNSEAGHMNIGAGRICEQDAVRINHCIYDGTFYKNAALTSAVNHANKNNSAIHIMGLLSDGMSAHSYPDHMYALIDFLYQKKFKKIYIHLFTDGRDSPQHGALEYLKKIKKCFKNGEKIASVMGRYYAMERNKRWSITEQAYDLLTLGIAKHHATGAQDAILQAYNRNSSDEFIKPTLIDKNGIINDNDSVIFINLRSDRTRQLTKAFVQKDFNQKNPGAFIRKKVLKNIQFVAMTDFGPDLDNILSAFPSIDLAETLPMVLDNKRQLYIAESEKYAHVTFFFNGGYADPVNNEERMKIPSPDVASYDQAPRMSADLITKQVTDFLKKDAFDFYCINYANPDMVGHTGNLAAAIEACSCTDEQIGKLWQAVEQKNGILVVTADHGNAEEMMNLVTGEIDTKHSQNPVPLIITKKGLQLKEKGCLGNIAPTILKLAGLPTSKLMTEKSLC